jgi:hypothetical protein
MHSQASAPPPRTTHLLPRSTPLPCVQLLCGDEAQMVAHLRPGAIQCHPIMPGPALWTTAATPILCVAPVAVPRRPRDMIWVALARACPARSHQAHPTSPAPIPQPIRRRAIEPSLFTRYDGHIFYSIERLLTPKCHVLRSRRTIHSLASP